MELLTSFEDWWLLSKEVSIKLLESKLIISFSFYHVQIIIIFPPAQNFIILSFLKLSHYYCF